MVCKYYYENIKNFKNLKILLIYTHPVYIYYTNHVSNCRINHTSRYYTNQDMEQRLNGIIGYLDMKNILKNYQLKNFRKCLLFFKR